MTAGAATVAGIDLSGRTRGTTALAIAEAGPAGPRLVALHAEPRLRSARGDIELIARCVEARVRHVALDAPLTLPHPVWCTDPGCPECMGDPPARGAASRRCEDADAWRAVDHVEKPPMAAALLAGISYRAIHLSRRFAAAGIACHETWPMGTYRALLRPSGHDGPVGDDARRRALAGVVAGLEDVVAAAGIADGALRDALDAVAAAYAAHAVATGAATAVGNPDEGLIWFAGG